MAELKATPRWLRSEGRELRRYGSQLVSLPEGTTEFFLLLQNKVAVLGRTNMNYNN